MDCPAGMRRLPAPGRPRAGFLLLVGILAMGHVLGGAAPAHAQVGTVGEWRTLPQTSPINPIHVALLRTGRVLIVAGSENDPTVTTNRAALWDPGTGAFAVQTIPWDLFCNAMSFLPDGRVLTTGGNLQYNPFRGIRTATIFDPATEAFAQVQDMARGRWYPSNVALGDGRTMTFSGWLETGGTNNAVELYSVPGGWSAQRFAPFTPPLYPWLHLLPDGRVFQSGAQVASHIFNPGPQTWATNVAGTAYPNERTYGSSVMLPLRPSEGHRARIMIMGGDNPATATAEIIDLSQPSPAWRSLPPMSAPRIQMNAVLLPTGKVLALGGSAQNNTEGTASLGADLFDPDSETWTPAGRMARRADVPLRRAAPARRDRLGGGLQPPAGHVGQLDGDLPPGLPVHAGRRRGRAAVDRGRAGRRRLQRRLPGDDAERRRHRLGRAGAAGLGDARVRLRAARRQPRLHAGLRQPHADLAAHGQRRPAGLLHAVPDQPGGRAVGRAVGAGHAEPRQPAAARHDQHPERRRHHPRRRVRDLRRLGHRHGRHGHRLRLELPRRDAGLLAPPPRRAR